jgi:hypothetical protein
MSRGRSTPDGELGRSVLASVGRVGLPALGVVVVMAIGAWLAAVGAAVLTWVLGLGGAFALGLLLTGLWAANRTASWLAALVFLPTMIFPVIALGRDTVLAAHGQRVPGVVTGYRHASGSRSSSDYTELRTRDGRYVEVPGRADPTSDEPVTILVDPSGTVTPQLASDVRVGWDLGWSMAGLVVVLAIVVGLGISGERNQR